MTGEQNQVEATTMLRGLLQGLPDEASSRLQRSLERTASGYPEDLRTPLYDSKDREEIIAICADDIGRSEFEELEEIDRSEREKIGPMSIMLPYSERVADVKKYWHQEFRPNTTAFVQARRKVSQLFPPGSLRPASFDTAYGLMPKDTSLGLPWLTRDRRYAQSYFERAKTLSSPEELFPCVLYWRGQAKGLREIPKQRVVWGFDHAETILGATILYPVLNHLRHVPGFSAWMGDVYVDVAMTRILKRAQNRRILSVDYSGFDSSLHRMLLDAVDSILSGWFSDPGPERVALLGYISKTVPLVVPDGILEGRSGGMPSGSVLTNLRDTIANLIAGWYVAFKEGSYLEDYEVLGDDSVFLYADDLSPEIFSEAVSDLGLTSNPEKQFVSDTSAHFLQRWHSLSHKTDGICTGVRSPYRALSGMLGYERFRQDWNKYMDTARWIMQVENVKHDPRFTSFVRFLKNGDKVLKSGMDPATVFKRAGGSDVIRSTLSIASFPFNVQDPDKVEVFETTRVLRLLD